MRGATAGYDGLDGEVGVGSSGGFDLCGVWVTFLFFEIRDWGWRFYLDVIIITLLIPLPQLLAILLPHLPHLPLFCDYAAARHAALETAAAFAADELRTPDGAVIRDRPAVWATERRSRLRMVRADRRVRRIQQSVHLPGQFAFADTTYDTLAYT